MSKKKKIIFGIVFLILFFVSHISLLFVAGKLVTYFAYNPKLNNVGRYVQNHVVEDYVKDINQEFKVENEWFELAKKEFLTIESFDGLKLHSVKLENFIKTNKWVVLVHGYRGSVGQMSNYAKHYFQNGYNIIIPSLRGHWFSEGDSITFGWLDRFDILSWVETIIDIDINSQIVIHGLSMGATTVMNLTGENLPNNVKVAISDCGFSSIYDEYSYLATSYLKIKTEPIISVVDYYTKKRLGFSIYDADTKKQLNKSVTPTLFIHGSIDTFVPAYMLDINFDSAINLVDGETKEKLLIKGAFHGMSAAIDEKLYWDTVWNFIGKFLHQ